MVHWRRLSGREGVWQQVFCYRAREETRALVLEESRKMKVRLPASVTGVQLSPSCYFYYPISHASIFLCSIL